MHDERVSLLHYRTGGSELRLAAGRDLIALTHDTSEQPWRIVFEHFTGRRLVVVDHQETISELGRDGAAKFLARLPLAAAKADRDRSMLRIGKREVSCVRALFDRGDSIVETWSAPIEHASPATERLAWAFLTGCRVSLPGIPLRVVIRSRKDLSTPAAEVEAFELSEETADAWLKEWIGRNGERASTSIPARKQATRVHAASPPNVADFAWIPGQDLLNRIRTVGNRITTMFTAVTGFHSAEKPHVHLDSIDWFSILRAGLTPVGLRTMDGLLIGMLLQQIARGASIAPMSDTQRTRYNSSLAEAETLLPDLRPAFIVTSVSAAFGDEALFELAMAETAEMRKPFEFNAADADGNPLVTVEGTIEEIAMRYRASHFDLTVIFGGTGNVSTLAFLDGIFRVGITLTSITVAFAFETWSDEPEEDPDRDDSGGLFAAITNTGHAIARGVKAFLLFNSGLGSVTMPMPVFTIDVAPAAPTGLRATFNNGLSNTTARMDLFPSPNLPEAIIVALGTRLTSTLGDSIGRTIAENVKKLTEDFSFAGQWPEAWHAKDGPEVGLPSAAISALSFVNGAAQFTGALAEPVLLFNAIPPGPLDATQTTFSGIALTRAYLLAWLRRRLAAANIDLSRSFRIDVDAFEKALGVKVPFEPLQTRERTVIIDGQTVHLFLDGSFVSDQMLIERLNAFNGWRGVDVALPDGSASFAAMAHLRYLLVLGVMRRVTQQPDVDLPRGDSPRDFGGAHGDPVAGLDDRPRRNGRVLLETEEVLVRYLEVGARVSVPLRFGLRAGFADVALPTLDLAIREDTILDVSIEPVSATSPIADTPTLRSYLTEIVRADAEKIFEPLRNPSSPALAKSLVPLIPLDDPAMRDSVMNFLIFRQAGGGDAFTYFGRDGWVYWSWDWVDDFGSWFPPPTIP